MSACGCITRVCVRDARLRLHIPRSPFLFSSPLLSSPFPLGRHHLFSTTTAAHSEGREAIWEDGRWVSASLFPSCVLCVLAVLSKTKPGVAPGPNLPRFPARLPLVEKMGKVISPRS